MTSLAIIQKNRLIMLMMFMGAIFSLVNQSIAQSINVHGTINPVEGVVTTLSVTFDGLEAATAYPITFSADGDLNFNVGARNAFRTLGAQTLTFTVTVPDDDIENSPARTGEVRIRTAFSSVTISVTHADNEAYGFYTIPLHQHSILEIARGGNTAIFGVGLNRSAHVVLAVSNVDTNVSTVNPTELVFTPDNWNMPSMHQVTVTSGTRGGNDRVILSVVDDRSSDNYDPLDNVAFSVRVNSPRFLANPSNLHGVTEDSFVLTTISLTNEPTADVTLAVTSDSRHIGTITPSELIFTSSNYNTGLEVRVNTLDNTVVGDVAFTVTLSATDGAAEYLLAADVELLGTIDDDNNDRGSITFAETEVPAVAEDGTAMFGVSLGVETLSHIPVVVTFSASYGTDFSSVAAVTFTNDLLTFTSSNWDTVQQVQVGGQENDLIGPLDYTITASVVSGPGSTASRGYRGLTATTSGVLNDNDGGAVSLVTVPDANIGDITEQAFAPVNGRVQVSLSHRPVSDVVVSVIYSDPSLTAVFGSLSTLLTFTTYSWDDNTHFIDFQAADDVDSDDTDYTITLDVISGPGGYGTLADKVLTGTIIDNDIAGFTITAGSSGLTEGSPVGIDFRVVLDLVPTTDVELIVHTAATELSVNTTLTFTAINWNVAQTFKVLGVEDDFRTGTLDGLAVTVGVRDIPGTTTDADYTALEDQELSVIFFDNESADIVLDPASTVPELAEGGSSTNVQIKLDKLLRDGDGDVLLTVTSSDPTAATVAPALLTFTGANATINQAVAVSPVDDGNNVDGDQAYTITIAVVESTLTVVDRSTNYAFDGAVAETLTGTVIDNDPPVSLVTFPAGAMPPLGEINEGERSPTNGFFEFRLSARPASNVVVSVIYSDASLTGDSGGSLTTLLTFTTGNWNTDKTVEFEAGEDTDLVDNDFTITLDVISGPSNYRALADKVFTGTIIDNDVTGFTLSGSGFIGEGNAVGRNLNVVLDLAPTTEVELTVHTADVQLGLDKATLTFTTTNWAVTQAVKVTAIEDDFGTGAFDTTVTVGVRNIPGRDTGYTALADQTRTFRFIDNDASGIDIVVDPSAVPELAEGGSSTDVQVRLGALPDPGGSGGGNVILTVTSSDPTAATVAPSLLTFTSVNATLDQAVAVSPVDDSVSDGDQDYIITIAVVDASSNDAFDAAFDETLTGTVTDNEDAGFTLTPSDGSALSDLAEGSVETTFTVVLNAQPLNDVVFDVSTTSGDISLSDSSLTFLPNDWDTALEVTVTSRADNNMTDGNAAYTVTVSVNAGSSDNTFDSLPAQMLNGMVTDDEVPGFTLSPSDSDLAEGSVKTTFTVVLNERPLNNVVFDVSTTSDDISLSSSSLTFAQDVWDIAQTVTVTSRVDNDDLDGNAAYTVTVAVDEDASDDAFDDLADQTLTGMVTDDDVPGFTLNLDPTTSTLTEIAEDSSTTFTAVLNAQPSSDVVLALTSSDTSIATVTARLTFEPGNWNVTQTVDVAGVDNGLIDGTRDYTITVAIYDDASDDNFDRVANQELNGTVTDDDAGLLFSSLTLTLADITVNSDVGTTETVKLSKEPMGTPMGTVGTVVLTLTSSNSTVAVVSPETISFTGGPDGNWNTPYPLTVTPGTIEEVGDGLDYTIEVSVSSSNDTNFIGIASTLSGTVIDDGLSEEQTEIAIASADTFGTAQVATDLISGHLLAPPAALPQAQLAGIALGSTTNLPVRSDLEKDPWGDDEDNAWQHDIADLIPGTEFTLPLSDTDSSGGHYEIWGAAGYSDLSGDPTSKGEKTEYDGHATGVHIGIGRRYVNGTSFGVSIGSTKVKLDIDTGSGDPVKVERDLISIHPYIGWTFQDGLAAWLIAGYGDGDYEQDKEQTDASLLMLGGGVQRSWSVNGNDVAVRLEGVTTESKLDTKGNLTGESSAWQGRVEFEIGRSFVTGGGQVQPYGTFGYRYDGGDLGGSGAGEIGLGLRSQLAASWTIDVKSRFQVTDSDHERRSIQGHVKYDRDTDRRGWLFTFSNSFEYEVEDADTAAEYTRVLEGSVGYGWSRTLLSQRGIVGVYLETATGDDQTDPKLSWVFEAPDLQLGVDGSSEEMRVHFNYISNW